MLTIGSSVKHGVGFLTQRIFCAACKYVQGYFVSIENGQQGIGVGLSCNVYSFSAR